MKTWTLTPNDRHYPDQLAQAVGPKTPSLLNCQGNLDLLQTLSIGFSGSRRASSKGLDLATTYASEFARTGWTVVSGYANGIDLASHSGALKAGGSTIIVLPHGLDHFRLRPELQDLWDWSRTLVLSQFSPHLPFQAFRAIQRNTVIAGLSQAVLAFEAASLGGTLNTGLTTLAIKMPLFIPLYSGLPLTAVGHRLLLARGAKPLDTDQETVTNNVKKVAQQIETAHLKLTGS